jgi:hypothetical protein
MAEQGLEPPDIRRLIIDSETPEDARNTLKENGFDSVTFSVHFADTRTTLQKIIDYLMGRNVLSTRDGSVLIVVALWGKDRRIVYR